MESIKTLNVHQMAIKYKCSEQSVRKYAQQNAIPFDIDLSRRKVYKFFPKHEEMFANRDTKTGRRHYSRLCVIQYPEHGNPLIHVFSGYKDAFLYAHNHTAHARRYTINSKRYNSLIEKSGNSERATIQTIVTSPTFIGPLYVWQFAPEVTPIFFDYQNTFIHPYPIEQYFSFNQRHAIIIQEQTTENTEAFCLRIHQATQAAGSIALATIHQHFNIKNALS